MTNTLYHETLTLSIHLRRAGSELLEGARRADGSVRTRLYKAVAMCDRTLEQLRQQQTAGRDGNS